VSVNLKQQLHNYGEHFKHELPDIALEDLDTVPRVAGDSIRRQPRKQRPLLAFAVALILAVAAVGVLPLLLRADNTTSPGNQPTAPSPTQAPVTTQAPASTVAAPPQSSAFVVVYGPESGVEDGCASRLVATTNATWVLGPCGLLESAGVQWSLATELQAPMGAFELAVAPDGTVWIGHVDTGVVSYDGESLIEHDVVAPWVEVTPDGTVWAHPVDRGLVSFDGVAWVEEPDAGAVRALAVDDVGTLWVYAYESGDDAGTEAIRFSIRELNSGDWVLHEPPGSIERMENMKLIAAPDGIVLFDQGSVHRFDGTDWTLVAVPSLTDLGIVPVAPYEDDPEDVVDTWEFEDAAITANGDLWIASNLYGALLYSDGDWVRYTTEDGLASNHLTFVEIGRDGSVWFGSSDAGLTRLVP
jgi:hypothetical protein